MKIDRQSVAPQGVGTLMYVGDEAPSVSIDIGQVVVGAFAATCAYKSKSLGPLAKALLVVGGVVVAKRGISIR